MSQNLKTFLIKTLTGRPSVSQNSDISTWLILVRKALVDFIHGELICGRACLLKELCAFEQHAVS